MYYSDKSLLKYSKNPILNNYNIDEQKGVNTFFSTHCSSGSQKN